MGSLLVGQEFFIIQEFIAGGTLLARIKDERISEHLTKVFTCGILHGLSHLHNMKVIHRDIKRERGDGERRESCPTQRPLLRGDRQPLEIEPMQRNQR
jgi:serine/threonine protein kinase